MCNFLYVLTWQIINSEPAFFYKHSSFLGRQRKKFYTFKPKIENIVEKCSLFPSLN